MTYLTTRLSPTDENHASTPPPVNTRDSGSFGVELAKQIPALRSLAKMLTRDEDAAADLTQDTLAKAWKARRSFAAGTNLKAWLFTIMRNHFRSNARRAWRQVPWEQEAAERIAGPSSEQLWTIELDDTVRAVARLPKQQRDALILMGVGGLSGEDACAIVRCRRTALKSRVARARHTVHSILEGTTQLKSNRSKRNGLEELVGQLQVLTTRAA